MSEDAGQPEIGGEPEQDTGPPSAFAGAFLEARKEVVPTPPMTLSRKHEIMELAFEIAERVETEKVEGRGLCLLDAFCHRLLEFS